MASQWAGTASKFVDCFDWDKRGRLGSLVVNDAVIFELLKN